MLSNNRSLDIKTIIKKIVRLHIHSIKVTVFLAIIMKNLEFLEAIVIV